MTPTIYQVKEQTVTDAPLFLFDCQLGDGSNEHWSTSGVTVGTTLYAARVIRHNFLDIQAASEQGIDSVPRLSLDLANADSHFSEIERNTGFKGAKITVSFLFFDLRNKIPASSAVVLFQGLANSPDLITETTFRVGAINRLSMQRVMLPEARLQRRCPWDFPTSPSQRSEAVSGGARGKYSRYYRCGYSADVTGGAGTLNSGAAFADCSKTRADCTSRGMFQQGPLLQPTARFGGIEFVPSTILVRSAGEKGSHWSPVNQNDARYNDLVPLIYGTAWHAPSIVFARNDGNLTRMEVLVGMGTIQTVYKVLVNDIEIPIGVNGLNMTGTGWFNIISYGTRNGSFNPDFSNGPTNPLGDPYGSMAFLSVVVPNRISDGRGLPRVQVLIDGLKLPEYAADGTALGESFTNNPAWVVLDLLQRSGWQPAELDLASFANTAAYCATPIQTQDLHGNTIMIARFQCNLVVKNRRSAGELLRGIRNSSRMYFAYTTGGLLQLRIENTVALQQPVAPPGSNSTSQLNGGWPAYEFGDGSTGVSGIVRENDGSSSVKLSSRNAADSPNRFSVEFQDALNEYQQDSYSVVDASDVNRTSQEIQTTLSALGTPNYDQAARLLKFNLDRSIKGNSFIEFRTSVKAVGLSAGDIITVTYLKEGLTRQPFRILKLSPAANFRTASITAQIHDDAWYSDSNGQTSGNSGGRRQPTFGIGAPRPISGTTLDINGNLQFDVVETSSQALDGTTTLLVNVGFISPGPVSHSAPNIPLVSLAATPMATGGTLPGGRTLYYAVSCVDATTQESGLSFIIRTTTGTTTQTNSTILNGLSFPSTASAFNVYRGNAPSQMVGIALNVPLITQFTDMGAPLSQTILPPDPYFDHANFYWRLELQPEIVANLESPSSIGNSTLAMIANQYQSMTVRITRGTGLLQERTILSNSPSVLNVSPPWDITPDGTSFFLVAQTGFQFGATGKGNRIQFPIPNRVGAIVEISGRSANSNDGECPYEVSPLTRWVVGGAGIRTTDAAVAPAPVFGVSVGATPGGALNFGAIAFPNLSNTTTVSAGTFTLLYYDELNAATNPQLSAAVGASDTTLLLSSAGVALPGSFIQLDGEILAVTAVTGNGTQYHVTRGQQTTSAAAHSIAALVFQLSTRIFVVPFVRNFFGSPASGSWSYSLSLPNARVVSASLFVSNSQGDSAITTVAFTGTVDSGLRTLSGGQYSFQIASFQAIQTGAAPDIVIDSGHVVNDISAVVKQAPTGSPLSCNVNLNGTLYCTLTIPANALSSQTVSGRGLPAFKAGDHLSLDISAVGVTSPGSDLTVLIRV